MALSKNERKVNHDWRVSSHKITFMITDDRNKYNYDMFILPESYTLDRPSRTTVVQTRGGAFIDDFGLGIGQISIAGTTGFGQMPNNAPYFNETVPNASEAPDGFDRWKGLVNFFETFYRWQQADDFIYTMHFYNWQEKDSFVVYPTGLPKLTRSVREPLLFRYDLQLTVLDKVKNVDYSKNGKLGVDPLAGIGVRTDRAPAIGTRIEEQLNNQAILVGTILNNQDIGDFDPTDPSTNPFGELPQDLQDAAVDGFNADLIRRQAPANYTAPLDSVFGPAGRTRGIADKIKDYANGTTGRIDTTIGEVQATVKGWRDVLDAAEYAVNLPVVYAREVRETLCAVQSLLLYPQLFVNSVSAALTDLSTLLLDSGCATTLRR